MDLIVICNMFPTNTKYTFYSAAHRSVSKIDHNILEHKRNLNKIRKKEITPWILADNNAVKFKIVSKPISSTYKNSQRLNNWMTMGQQRNQEKNGILCTSHQAPVSFAIPSQLTPFTVQVLEELWILLFTQVFAFSNSLFPLHLHPPSICLHP